MKVYKEEGQLIIDGEKDFTIGRQREYVINLGKNVEHTTIRNFHYYMIPSKFIEKLILLYRAGKYILQRGVKN